MVSCTPWTSPTTPPAAWTRSPWSWRRYDGANAHTTHVHVSVVAGTAADLERVWRIAAAPPPPPATVRQGSKGAAVRALQTRLVAAGYKSLVVDGTFGPATLKAVRAFQKKKGLTVDGVVGPRTWAAL